MEGNQLQEKFWESKYWKFEILGVRILEMLALYFDSQPDNPMCSCCMTADIDPIEG